MKKFFFRLHTSAVKSMHAAFCIVLFSVSVLAQNSSSINKPDSIPFHKWEVSLDVKPLFRNDAPYNIIGKWHFSERGALRLGLGTNIWSNKKDSFKLDEFILDTAKQLTYIGFSQNQFGPNETRSTGYNIKIGYQYKLTEGIVELYSATDFEWSRNVTNYNVPFQIISYQQGANEPFINYQSIVSSISRLNSFGLIQSFGLSYRLKNFLSISFESSLKIEYQEFYNIVSESSIYKPEIHIQTLKGGNTIQFIFNPILGLFFNFYF